MLKAKFEAVQNSRVVTVSTAALFSARRTEAWADRWVYKRRQDTRAGGTRPGGPRPISGKKPRPSGAPVGLTPRYSCGAESRTR